MIKKGESMAKISVIVPVYNVEKYISECIQSILAQTYKDIELILVNDGSSDQSGEICDGFANKNNRVKVIHIENSGPSAARNTGIEIATGEYIAFVDADDTIEPNMYEILLNQSLIHNADIVVCPFKTFNLVNNTTSVSSVWNDVYCNIDKRKIEKYLIPSILNNTTYSLISVFNKLYRKTLFDSNGIRFDIEKSHSEDVRLNFTLLTKISNLVFVEQPFYNYFIRERESLTNKVRSDLHLYAFDNKHFMIDLCKKYKLEKLINSIREHFTKVLLTYLHDVVNSDLSDDQKYRIIIEILKDDEFHKDLNYVKTTSIYQTLLKYICTLRNERICFHFIKFKLHLQLFINKVKNNENK